MKRLIKWESTKDIVLDYIYINIGAFVTAVGIALFLAPASVAPGGVSGLAIVVNYLTGYKIGTLMLIFNIPIFLLGLKVFGRKYGMRTFTGTIMLSVYVDLLEPYTKGFLNVLDFTKGSNYLLAPVFGGVLVGAGIGLIMKYGGSTGGTDILAQILNKYTKISMGHSMMLVDFMILLSAAFVFGLEKTLYAIIAIYTVGVVINMILAGENYSKLVFIISDEYEKITKHIITDIDRGGNLIDIKGMYSNQDKQMIMTVVKKKDIFFLKSIITYVDPNAFVIISDTHDVLGDGFTPIERSKKMSKEMEKVVV